MTNQADPPVLAAAGDALNHALALEVFERVKRGEWIVHGIAGRDCLTSIADWLAEFGVLPDKTIVVVIEEKP